MIVWILLPETDSGQNQDFVVDIIIAAFFVIPKLDKTIGMITIMENIRKERLSLGLNQCRGSQSVWGGLFRCYSL